MRLGGPALAAALVAAMGVLGCAEVGPLAPTDRASLPRRDWPTATAPRAVILAVHGFNDYSHAFAEFGAFAAAQGIAVHAYDQQGFGANPNAGRWPGTATLTADLAHERARLAERYPGVPVYILGESMGAAVVIAAVARGEPLDAAGLILSAPAVWGGDQLNRFYRATLWLAAHLAPGLKLTGRGLKKRASDNDEVLLGLGADPLFIKETRVDAIAGLVELMDLAYAEVEALPGPLLVLIGERDEIVPPDAQKVIVERLSAAPCDRVVYPDGWHMLLRDLQRQVVWNDVLAWTRGEPLPSGRGEACVEAIPVVAARG